MVLKKNKITALIMSCILTVSLMTFAGCGNAGSGEEGGLVGGSESETGSYPFEGVVGVPLDDDFTLFLNRFGDTWESYYGEYRSTVNFFNYDIDYDNVLRWNAFEDIDESSVEYIDDKNVIFKTKGPDGNPVRFWGHDITVGENEITLHENGYVVNLDSIGRVFSVDPVVSDPGYSEDILATFGAYDMEFDKNPASPENMIYTHGNCRFTADYMSSEFYPVDYPFYDLLDFQPNFVGVGCDTPNEGSQGFRLTQDVVISDIQIIYEEDDEPTRFREVFLDPEFYGSYLDGERYDAGREKYDPKNHIYDFYMWAIPDLKHERYPLTIQQAMHSVMAGTPQFVCNISEGNLFEIQGIKGNDGTVRDRFDTEIYKGDSIVVTIGEQTFDVKPEVVDQYTTAETMHDLVPYAFTEAKGDLKVLAIPIAWPDEPENSTEDNLDEYRAYLGRVADESGNVTDYTSNLPDDQFSLSDYFDRVSYGNLSITTYMTDWYMAPGPFSEQRYYCLDTPFFDNVLDWLYRTYPDVDFGSFDREDDGYFDAVIFLNSGSPKPDGSYNIISFEGAICYRLTYGNEYAGTVDRPYINGAVTINSLLFDDNTLIHEFSHILGLIDYYDVTYSGIDALGGYDMQDSNQGDWNAYSKYAVGWLEPTIVQGLSSGESVDVEIGVMGETGDMIAIPVAGSTMDDPFAEYIMVDLFDDTGVNRYNAHYGMYDIGNAPGVRIYHVDARMEYRDYISSEFPDMEPCPVGTIHYANTYSEYGYYNIELIQRGGHNSFTVLTGDPMEERKYVTDEDFFRAGDVFTTDDYIEFFYENKFNEWSDFGYSIEVVSITGSGEDARAVIRITRL